MKFHVMTLFPEMIEGLNTSILGRAMDKGLISVNAVNIRDYTLDKHRRVDDYPYGGGAGMVMAADPVVRCYEHLAGITVGEEEKEQTGDTCENEEAKEQTGNVCGGEETIVSTDDVGVNSNELQEIVALQGKNSKKRTRVVYLTPQGTPFKQSMAEEFAKEDELIFLCGHYEGIDERALQLIVTDYVSIGDYVLTGGELPVMVMIDAISRLVPGVLNNEVSAEFESFNDNLLEYPQYTRPEVYRGMLVPEVLTSGHHANIEKWRREQSIIRTHERRPDLMDKAVLSKKEQKFYEEYKKKKEK